MKDRQKEDDLYLARLIEDPDKHFTQDNIDGITQSSFKLVQASDEDELLEEEEQEEQQQEEQQQEEQPQEPEAAQEALTPEEIEALEATAAGAQGNNGHDTAPRIGFGDFSQPTSLPRGIGTQSNVGAIEFQELRFAFEQTGTPPNLIPDAVDDMNMGTEPLPCPCNLVIIIDVSLTMVLDGGHPDASQLELAKKAAIEAIEKYELLGQPLNLTVIPFASNVYINATRTEYFGDDVASAIEFINDLNLFHEFLGPFTEYDDALKEAHHVLESQLQDEELEGYQHKVLFISDGEPTEGETGDVYPQWKTFIEDNNINVLGIVISPEVSESEYHEAFEPVVNDGDSLVVLENHEDIEGELVPNLPFKAIYLMGNVLENDSLGDPPTTLTSIAFCVVSLEEAEYYAMQAPQSSISPNGELGYIVTLDVPEEGLSVNTLLGGSLEIASDGIYSYWGPPINIPEGNLSEKILYTITDVNGDADTAELVLLLKDTVLEAYDNARYIEPLLCEHEPYGDGDEQDGDDREEDGEVAILAFAEGSGEGDYGSGDGDHEDGCPCDVFEYFYNEYQYKVDWDSKGHDHIVFYNYSQRLLLSTYDDRYHSSHENVVRENTLASLILLGNNALDDVKGRDAEYGSAAWQDLELNPGDKICFDYNFFTNDRQVSKEADFAFISIAGNGQEFVYVFSDVFDPYLYHGDVYLDNVEWEYLTGWQEGEVMIPIDWESGTYRVAFGVMDVNDNFDLSPKDKANEASMVLLDNIGLKESTLVKGNVILDPNEDVLSEDPIGVEDLILADGGLVSLISFAVDDPDDYLDNHDLSGVGAYADGSFVRIPVAGEVSFETPEGGMLQIDQYGQYLYMPPEHTDAPWEQFEYTLSEVWGTDTDTAHLTFYFTDMLPAQGSEDEGVSEVYQINLDDGPMQLLVQGLGNADVLQFNDVVDINDPNGLDIDDVITSFAQQGDDVVIRLANDGVVVLQDVGTIANVGPTPGQTVETFIEDTLNATVNVSGTV